MSMNPEQTSPKRRFQLHLADLIFVAVLVGVVGGFVLPVLLKHNYSADPGLPYPSLAGSGIPVEVHLCGAVTTMIVAVFVLITTSGFKQAQSKRWLLSALGGSLAGVLAAAISGPQFIRGKMAHNETLTVGACKEYCAAQDAYIKYSHNKQAISEYSRSARGNLSLSDPDIHLIDQAFANAFYGEGAPPIPKNGYIFKILKAQKGLAVGGPKSYFKTDETGVERMTEGYALVAAPAVYDHTGRNTFIVSHTGEIYQRDCGDKTPEIFRNMTEFDLKVEWMTWP